MRRITTAGIAALSVPLLLAACSSGDSGGESTGASTGETTTSAAAAGGTLVIWADNSANTAKAIEPLCTKWASENGVTCRVQKFDGGGPLEEALLKAVQAGNDVPDIFEAPHNGLGKYLKEGVVAPVDIQANKDKYSQKAVDAVTAQGNTFGVPWAVENVALLVNKKLAPNCPATLDEAVTNAKKLISEGKVTKGLGIALQIGNTGDAYHWQPLYSADGGYTFKQSSDGSWNTEDMGVGKDGSIAAGKRLGQLAKDGVIRASVTYDIAKESFAGGKSPYFVTGPWSIPDMQKGIGDDLMVCSVPSWQGSSFKSEPFLGVRVFFQTAKAPNPTLASTFLNDYVQTTEFMDGMYSVDPRPGAWLESFEKQAADPFVKAFGEYGQGGLPMPAIPQMDNIWADLGLAQFKIASGQDPATVLKEAGASINKKNAALG